MCNYALKFVSDEQQAQDVVQDVFVKLWDKFDSLGDDVKYKPYLFTSVRNKALEIYRHNNMKATHEEKIIKHELLNHDIDEDVEKYVRLEKIHQAIEQLPNKCKQIFVLSKIDGLTYEEIGNHLNIAKKTVENQIMRALKILREKLN